MSTPTVKPRWDLVPVRAMEDVVTVLTFGATKHSDYGWRRVSRTKHLAAAMRHIWAWRKGVRNDPETNVSHLAHAVARLLMIIDLEKTA